MKKKITWKWLIAIPALLLVVVGCYIFVWHGGVLPIRRLEHYNRVCENPLTVQATVTKHDENDDTYYSYVSYTVNGVTYKNVKFESGGKKQLTPLGTTLSLEVSPEDPSQLLTRLVKDSYIVWFSAALVALFLSFLWHCLFTFKDADNPHLAPNPDEVSKNAKLRIYCDASLAFFLLLPILYMTIYWRYPILAYPWVLFVCGGSMALWIWRVIVSILALRNVRKNNLVVVKDVLTRKYTNKDEDDNTHYYLEYTSSISGKTWSTATDMRTHEVLALGTSVTAVYLSGKKTPLYHYDSEGKVR